MHRILRWTTAVFYALALTVFLLKPPGGTSLFPQADKVAHFVALGILAALLLRALTDPRAPRPSILAWILGPLLALGYAVGMEFVQAHVGRDCSVWDMLAGALGILVFTLLWTRSRKRLILLR